jgi:peroxiredoxin
MKNLLILYVLMIPAIISGQGYKTGDIAIDFKLKNIDGNNVSMAVFTDACGFIVIFTCNHCPYAVAYEDRIIAIDNKYRKKGYPVIAINPNDPDIQPEDSIEKMKERAKDKSFTFPYLIDERQEVYPVYGATKTPHVFVLQKENGNLIVKYTGTIDDNYADASQVKKTYLSDAVDALLQGKNPDPDFTKAIGCSIKKR